MKTKTLILCLATLIIAPKGLDAARLKDRNNTKRNLPIASVTPEIKTTEEPLMSTNIGIKEADRKAVVNELKKIQADEFVLYTKTWNFHWNVTGMNFNDLHGFFKGQYESLQVFVDDVAERIRILGHVAPGTLQEFSKMSRIGEMPGEKHTDKAMLDILLEDHEALIQTLRKALDLTTKHNDLGTNNFLTDLMEKHEKMVWMLRSYLSK